MYHVREDPYEVLGVARGATAAEIARRYRILTHIFHPDRFHSMSPEIREEAERRMKSLNAAYDTLKRGGVVVNGWYERPERDARERTDREARERAQREARDRAQRAARERADREARERADREARERAEREVRERAEREARARADREARVWAEREAAARERAERVRDRVEREVRHRADEAARARYDRLARERTEREARARAEEEARERRRNQARLGRRVAVLVILIAAAKAAQGTLTGDANPAIPGGALTIQARDPSPVDTGMVVRTGQVVAFSATGTWCIGGAGPSAACGGPDGIPAAAGGDAPLIFDAAEPGALVARAGDGRWFKVGKGGDYTMPSSGRLVVVVNDRPCCYGDNSGQMKVRVSSR